MTDQHLVIGASGLIGSHLLEHLRRTHPSAKIGGTAFTRLGAGLIPFDLGSDIWPEGFGGPGVVYLCGAITRLGDVLAQPEQARLLNVDLSIRFVQAASDRGFRTVFLSTDKVYPNAAGPFHEGQAGAPSTRYGQLKWELDAWLLSNIPDALVCRLSKVYGPRQSLVQEIAQSLLQGESLVACSDLLFQPTHLDDVAAGITGLLAGGCRGAWNLAHPHAWTRLDLTRRVCRHLGLPPERIRSATVAEIYRDEPYPPDGRMDVSKFFRLHPQPFVSFEDALPELLP